MFNVVQTIAGSGMIYFSLSITKISLLFCLFMVAIWQFDSDINI